MTKEDKSLLVKDLCARLPYGVVMNVTEPGEDNVNFNCFLGPDVIKEIISETGHFKYKPYLRSMSSMTAEENAEWHNLTEHDSNVLDYIYVDDTDSVQDCLTDFVDWLNAHHFDYRGLIPMGIALPAPEGMYN